MYQNYQKNNTYAIIFVIFFFLIIIFPSIHYLIIKENTIPNKNFRLYDFSFSDIIKISGFSFIYLTISLFLTNFFDKYLFRTKKNYHGFLININLLGVYLFLVLMSFWFYYPKYFSIVLYLLIIIFSYNFNKNYIWFITAAIFLIFINFFFINEQKVLFITLIIFLFNFFRIYQFNKFRILIYSFIFVMILVFLIYYFEYFIVWDFVHLISNYAFVNSLDSLNNYDTFLTTIFIFAPKFFSTIFSFEVIHPSTFILIREFDCLIYVESCTGYNFGFISELLLFNKYQIALLLILHSLTVSIFHNFIEKYNIQFLSLFHIYALFTFFRAGIFFCTFSYILCILIIFPFAYLFRTRPQ